MRILTGYKEGGFRGTPASVRINLYRASLLQICPVLYGSNLLRMITSPIRKWGMRRGSGGRTRGKVTILDHSSDCIRSFPIQDSAIS